MITQSINLNLIPGAVPPRIKVSQYDFGSRTLSFTLFNGTSPFTTASLTARIQGTKPDNKGFSYDATYSAGVVTADVTRQMTACAGAVICELVIVDGSNNELGTGNFILDVEPSALSEDTDISDTEIPAIIDAAETNAERAEDAADRAEAASANPPYIGENEHWYVWDTSTSQYVDSGVDAEGVDGVGIVSIAKTGTVGLVDTYTITLSNGQTQTFTVTNGAEATLPSGGAAGQALIKNSSTASDASWKDISTTGAIKWEQASGDVQKNLMKNTATSETINGVTFTVNNDGSVTVQTESGGATGYTQIYINANIYLPSGSYTLSNGLETDIEKFSINLYNITDSAGVIGFGSGEVTVNLVSGKKYGLRIICSSGFTLTTPVTIYPMIRKASVQDSAYAPYVPSNGELDTRLSAAEGSISTLENQVTQNTYTFEFVTKNAPFAAVDTYETIKSLTLPAGTWHIIATHGQVGDTVSGARIAIGANVYGVNEQVARNITVETIIKLGATSTTIELQGKISAKGSGGNSMRYLYRKVAS